MAHCYICDKELTEVLLDHRDMKPRPCSECEEIIQDAVGDFNEDTIYSYIDSKEEEYDEEIRGEDRPLVSS